MRRRLLACPPHLQTNDIAAFCRPARSIDQRPMRGRRNRGLAWSRENFVSVSWSRQVASIEPPGAVHHVTARGDPRRVDHLRAMIAMSRRRCLHPFGRDATAAEGIPLTEYIFPPIFAP